MVKKNLYKGGNIVVYKNFKQLKLSALGMGSMRLPLIEGNNAKISANGGVLTGETLKVTLRKSYVGTETTTTTNYNVNCTINASGLSE